MALGKSCLWSKILLLWRKGHQGNSEQSKPLWIYSITDCAWPQGKAEDLDSSYSYSFFFLEWGYSLSELHRAAQWWLQGEGHTPRQCAFFPTYPTLKQKYWYSFLHCYFTVFSLALACPAAIHINRRICTDILFHSAAMLWNSRVNHQHGISRIFLKYLSFVCCLDLKISVH